MANETIKIRRATQRDAETLVVFNLAMAWETEEKELDPKTVERGVGRVLQAAVDAFYLVAERDDRVIGCVMVTSEWSDWRNGWFWWLQSVYVHPDFRQQGTFRQLFEAVRCEAENTEDVCGLRLYVEQGNPRAQRVYRQLGMTKTSYDLYELEFDSGNTGAKVNS